MKRVSSYSWSFEKFMEGIGSFLAFFLLLALGYLFCYILTANAGLL